MIEFFVQVHDMLLNISTLNSCKLGKIRVLFKLHFLQSVKLEAFALLRVRMSTKVVWRCVLTSNGVRYVTTSGIHLTLVLPVGSLDTPETVSK